MKRSSPSSTCPRTSCWRWLHSASLVLVLAATARADGKMFSPAVPVVETPDQRAILVFRDGVERLVVETAFQGEGDEFAWVVPCPSPPQVEKADPGLFRTLEVVTAPNVRREVGAAWLLPLYLLAVFAVVAWLAGRAPRSRMWLLVAVLMLGGFVLFTVTLVPKASLGAAADSVTVHGRGRVGAYDVATVSADDARDLHAWLERNGFQVAPESRAAIEAYVADGWTFAVARLAGAADGGRAVAHPLSFTFATERAVYPLRLTGAGNRDCTIDLYVFGDGRAVGDPLPTVQAHRVEPVALDHHRWWRIAPDETLTLGHAGLLALIGAARDLTLLRGTLSAEQQRRDLHLAWREFEPLVRHPMTRSAAATEAVNGAAWLALLLFVAVGLIAAIVSHVRMGRSFRANVQLENRALRFVWVVALGGGLAMGLVTFLGTETVEAEAVAASYRIRAYGHHEAAAAVAATHDLAEARAAAAAFWKEHGVIEEASPGNYVITLRDGKPVYAAYDAVGHAITFPRTP